MSTTTHLPTSSCPSADRARTATRTAVAAAVAVSGNTLVWALGRIGDPIRVVVGNDAESAPLEWGAVALTTIVAIMLGGVALAVLRRRGHPDRAWRIAVVAIAIVSSVPLWRLDIDVASKASLTLMHLFTGACSVIAQQRRPS